MPNLANLRARIAISIDFTTPERNLLLGLLNAYETAVEDPSPNTTAAGRGAGDPPPQSGIAGASAYSPAWEWTCGHVAGAQCAECYRLLAQKAHTLAEALTPP